MLPCRAANASAMVLLKYVAVMMPPTDLKIMLGLRTGTTIIIIIITTTTIIITITIIVIVIIIIIITQRRQSHGAPA
jgi:hypothetical protein